MVTDMNRYALAFAFSLALVACAADGGAGVSGSDLERQSISGLSASEGGESTETLDTTTGGVTDVEAALYASGITDEASTYVGAAQKPSCAQFGAITCSPRASGGVSHGSPQPLDPTPETHRGFEAKR